VALIAAVTLLAGAAGVLAGSRVAPRDEPAPTAPGMLASGPVQLELPDGWTATAPPFAVPELKDPAGARGLLAEAVLGVAPPQHVSLLPGSLRRLAGSSRSRSAPGVGPPVRRFEFVADTQGTRLEIAVGAATSGVVTLVCRLPPGAGRLGSEDCDELTQNLRLREGGWLEPGPETATRMVLPGVIARLAERRREGRQALATAGGVGARVRAAQDVAAAYAIASTTLRRFAAGRAEPLPRRLAALAAHHRALGRAYARPDRRAALRAGAAIAGDEARVDRALRRLAGG